MRVKSYFVPNVAAALGLARQELGPDAVLLETRRAPAEAAHLGEYEVVFGVPGSNPARSEPQSSAAEGLDRLMQEVAELRRQLERMSTAVTRSSVLGPAVSPADATAWMLARMVQAELEPELAMELIQQARGRLEAVEGGELEALLAAELEKLCPVDSSLGRPVEGPRVVALVGPSGAGKTATLVKLAVREGLERRRAVRMLSLDNLRVCGAEQLRQYATILGVAFQALETTQGLASALRECRGKELVLIDTPGYGAGEMEEAEELAQWLAARSDIDCHLVLTASMRSADLWRVAERFERFRPHKLLFTRLDETETYGPLWSLALRLAKPVSFLCAGQRIPEDLEAASGKRLVELLLGEPLARAAAASA